MRHQSTKGALCVIVLSAAIIAPALADCPAREAIARFDNKDVLTLARASYLC